MYENHFDAWIKVKEEIHKKQFRRSFHDRDVWWCHIGENVGVEINGKGDDFTRPVIIFKKLSNEEFLGIPLSTQSHEGSWYVSFVFNSKKQTAFLSQVRTFDVKRLKQRIGQLSELDYKAIKLGLLNLYFRKNSP